MIDYLRNDIFVIMSVILWLIVLSIILYLSIFGFKKLRDHGLAVLSLKKLDEAINNLFSDVPKSINRKNTIKIGTTIFWRITRFGIILFLVSLFPILLLIQQNRLISKQNILFKDQNSKIDQQVELFKTQNVKIDSQLSLLSTQNILFTNQNNFIESQTKMFDKQSKRIDKQTSLFAQQNDLIDAQIRPFISVSNNEELSKFSITVYNRPAYIDTIIIEYSLKEYGVDGFSLVDRDTLLSSYIYPGEKTGNRLITNNILTKEFIDDIIDRKARLARYTKIVYSPIYDGLKTLTKKKNYVNNQLYFLSRKSRNWFQKKFEESNSPNNAPPSTRR